MKKTNDLKKQSPATSCQLVESFWSFWPAFQRWAESQTMGKGLTPQRTRILAILEENGPQIMSELRVRLGVTATNITALVDALEKDGLVVRKSHPTDRRATVIEIDGQAAKKMSQGCSVYRERVGELFSTLSEGDRKDLLRMMKTLRAQLEETSKSHPDTRPLTRD
ncbi:MAG: MarR family transcriptional regulator [Bdellovibrionota bacterium]